MNNVIKGFNILEKGSVFFIFIWNRYFVNIIVFINFLKLENLCDNNINFYFLIVNNISLNLIFSILI